MSVKPHQPKQLQDGSIRLRGQSGSHQGWLEVYLLGHWGTVCNDGWDLLDATVVCRKLGFSKALTARDYPTYQNASGVVWFDKISCNGSEADLTQCSSSGLGLHDCSHMYAAGVACSSELPSLSGRNICIRVMQI